jgi:hypothetical protein
MWWWLFRATVPHSTSLRRVGPLAGPSPSLPFVTVEPADAGPISTVRVHALLDLWDGSDKGYIGNQMFIFMSTVGVAVHNSAKAVFTRKGAALIEETFLLDHLSNRLSFVDSIDSLLPAINLDHGEPMPILNGDAIVQSYLQSKIYMRPAARAYLKFWRFRPYVIEAAMLLLQNHTRWVGVHMRHFSRKAFNPKEYPQEDVLLPYIQNLMKPGKCVMVFGNDIAFSRSYFAPLVSAAPPGCISFVDPGPTRFVEAHGNEIHPDSHASRDLAALSLCEDVVSTVGTFSYWAMALHEGRGHAHYFARSPDIERLGFPRSWLAYGQFF